MVTWFTWSLLLRSYDPLGSESIMASLIAYSGLYLITTTELLNHVDALSYAYLLLFQWRNCTLSFPKEHIWLVFRCNRGLMQLAYSILQIISNPLSIIINICYLTLDSLHIPSPEPLGSISRNFLVLFTIHWPDPLALLLNSPFSW